jgi:hypothetical protein
MIVFDSATDARSVPSPRAGNAQETQMYIGGGLLLLIIALFLVLR